MVRIQKGQRASKVEVKRGGGRPPGDGGTVCKGKEEKGNQMVRVPSQAAVHPQRPAGLPAAVPQSARSPCNVPTKQ